MQKPWFYRNLGPISIQEQKLLFSSGMVVCGVGGVGGICNELLVRAGLGRLLTIDFDKFEKTNLNRQIHCTLDVLEQEKVAVLEKKLLNINPKLKFVKINQKLTPQTFLYFKNSIKNFRPKLILDAFDNAQARVLIYRISKELDIPYLFAACSKSRGIISLFLKKQNMEKLLNLPSFNLELNEAYNSLANFPTGLAAWGPTTNLVGALATNAALNFILKRKGYPLAPNYWSISGQEKKIFSYSKF
ncbi:MAG: ThiF family adenylyltransferase [Candidatus Micrarchaeota archaeon]|nr:ThiF family adenylyltransferase [Candidatus Micrarchaeota archaeon]